MLKNWLLRIHRWTTLVFSVPLAVLIVTGLILSFEPLVIGGGSQKVGAGQVKAALAKHDPNGQARMLVVRSYAGNLSLVGGPGGATHVDIASNEKIASPGTLANLFMASRQLHEKLMLDLGWLVTVSTIAMLLLIALGLLMGWPRLRNSLSGWHKGTGWVLLPLLILSPLTGLMMALGVTFTAPPPAGPAGPGGPRATVPLTQAVETVAAKFDLGQLTWIRARGPNLLARLNDGGEMRVFAVKPDGLAATARNWPRLLHEGNWSLYPGAAINIVISVALVLLMVTGLWMWARRQFRRRPARARAQAVAAPMTGQPAS